MIRTTFSYLVLILVPAMSLAIAVGPYVWVKRKSKSGKVRKWESGDVRMWEGKRAEKWEGEKVITWERENGGTLRPSDFQTFKPSNQVSLAYLWGAFFVGLVGNVAWWSLVFWITNDKISIYLRGMDTDGVLLAVLIYSVCIIVTSFIFYKLRHGHFTGKAIVYNVIISLITAGLVLGVWIVLAVVAYRGLFYRLN